MVMHVLFLAHKDVTRTVVIDSSVKRTCSRCEYSPDLGQCSRLKLEQAEHWSLNQYSSVTGAHHKVISIAGVDAVMGWAAQIQLAPKALGLLWVSILSIESQLKLQGLRRPIAKQENQGCVLSMKAC